MNQLGKVLHSTLQMVTVIEICIMWIHKSFISIHSQKHKNKGSIDVFFVSNFCGSFVCFVHKVIFAHELLNS